MKPVVRSNLAFAGMLLMSSVTLASPALLRRAWAEGIVVSTGSEEVPRLLSALSAVGMSLASTERFDSPTGERLPLMPLHRIAAQLSAIYGAAGKARESAECDFSANLHSSVFELDAILSGYRLESALVSELKDLRSAEMTLYLATAGPGQASLSAPALSPGQTNRITELLDALSSRLEENRSHLVSHEKQLHAFVSQVRKFIEDPAERTAMSRRELAGTMEGLGFFIPSSVRVEWIELRNAIEPALSDKPVQCSPKAPAQITAMQPFLKIRADLEQKAGAHYPRIPLDQRSIGAGIRHTSGSPVRNAAPPAEEKDPAGVEGESGEADGEAGDA